MQGDYVDFGKVMTFVIMLWTNIYDKSLALFVGGNHHLQNTFFFVLLGDETTGTSRWVFQAFKKCMGGT
jgi:hypothetical protein